MVCGCVWVLVCWGEVEVRGRGTHTLRRCWVTSHLLNEEGVFCTADTNNLDPTHLAVAVAAGVHIHSCQVVGPVLVWDDARDIDQLLLGTMQEGVLH